MNAITQFLLAGAVLGVLAVGPAMAGNVPPLTVAALHAGRVVNKTMIRDPSRVHVTYTFGFSTYIPASDLNKKVKLLRTYYKFGCSEKARVTKKATYGKVGFFAETYSTSCGGPFYGTTYKLTNPDGEGQTDCFVSTLTSKYEQNGVKYKGTLNMNVCVEIGE
jgi:hypothetical protein